MSSEAIKTQDYKYIAPLSPLEKELCCFYASTLNCPFDKVGVNNEFNQLGGHRTLGLNLLATLHHRYEITPPILLLALLNKSTIKQMAEIIKKELGTQQLNKILEKKPSTFHIGFFKRLLFKFKLLRQKNNI